MAKAKDEAESPDEPQKSGGSKMKIIFLALGAVLLIGASVGGTLFFIGGAQPSAEQAAAEEPVKEKGTPRYLKLDPAFTVNLEGSPGLLRISIAVLVYGDEVENILTQHMPQIRNSLVLLFSSQDANVVRERTGKEQLRQSTVETLRDIVGKYIDIEDMEVFFTGFVLQ